MFMTKTNVILIIFLLVAVMYLVYIIVYAYKKSKTEEHFVTEEVTPEAEDQSGKGYESRMYVMKVFDLVMNRKPTTEEIAKYSILGNEQDILVAVLKEFNKTDPAAPSGSASVSEEIVQGEEVNLPVKAEELYEDVASNLSNKVCIDKSKLTSIHKEMSDKLDQLNNLLNEK